jgi:hypothetical protein
MYPSSHARRGEFFSGQVETILPAWEKMAAMQVPVPGVLSRAVNRSHRLDGTAFAPGTPFGPPHGRYRTVHYGVMVPNLPPPLRFMDVIAVIGQPRIPIWNNSHLGTSTPADTVSLLTATGAPGGARHVGLSAAADCEFAADGSLLRFGDELDISGTYPRFRVCRPDPDIGFDLQLLASRTVTHFARMPGGVYDHWSLLCRYRGTFRSEGADLDAAGLCNLEYARGADIALPFRLFTYHVIDVDDRTQVLFGQVLGPLGARLQHEVYVRSLDEPSRLHRSGVRFRIQSYEPEPRVTPDGRTMRLPERFSWRARGARGVPLVAVEGRATGDWAYGMAAGYAGSFGYEGSFRGTPISGTGYVEYIDGR